MTTPSNGLFASAALALALTSGCSRAAAEFGPERQVSSAQRPVAFDLDQSARFGLREMGAPKAEVSQDPSGFTGDAPASWRVAPTSEFRQLNYKVGDAGECYLTAGNLRGGALANVNRWVESQFGKTALTQAEYDALPRHALLGSQAALVELEGDFRGMGGESRTGYKLLGLVGGSDSDLVTLKFVGPKDLVDAERSAFLAFAASVRLGGSKASEPAATPTNAGAGTGYSVAVGDGYAAMVPSTWQAQTPSQFRLLNFKIAGTDCECYLTAGGLRGGLLGNANRWVATQFGQAPLTQAQFDALPRHPLLGSPATLVEISGDFRGMDAQPRTGYRLLGLVGGTDDEMSTWKMIGPADVVERERANFLAVAGSIREGEKPAPIEGAATAPAEPKPVDRTQEPAPGSTATAPFAATIPAGWTAMGDTGSRILYHRFGDGGECYTGQLGGEPDQMLGIWFGEFAKTPPDAAAIAGLPKVPMLDGEAILVDLQGEHQGMTGQKRADMRLLVAVRKTDQGVVFCKCLGKAADVEQAKAGFLQYCATLKRNDG